MSFTLQPWQLLVTILAGSVNQRQHRTENQVLKEKLGRRRILLDDDQRRRLAVKGKVLGRVCGDITREVSARGAMPVRKLCECQVEFRILRKRRTPSATKPMTEPMYAP
jgi:hypothetical protein